MQKLKYTQELPDYYAPSVPVTKKIKQQMQNMRSTYEFENTVPNLREIAKVG